VSEGEERRLKELVETLAEAIRSGKPGDRVLALKAADEWTRDSHRTWPPGKPTRYEVDDAYDAWFRSALETVAAWRRLNNLSSRYAAGAAVVIPDSYMRACDAHDEILRYATTDGTDDGG